MDLWNQTSGALMHWNGTAWTEHDVGTEAVLRDVWGTGPNDVWVAADEGLFRWNGRQWKKVVDGPRDITALWAGGSDDLWAVGHGVYHWDGTSWSHIRELSGQFRDVVGLGPDSVWVGGRRGASTAVYHWDGTTWTGADWVGETADIESLWVAADGTLWAVTDKGVILHIDDTYSVSATIEPTTVSDADPVNNAVSSPILPVKDAGIALSYIEIEPPLASYAPLDPTTVAQAIFGADLTVAAMFPVSEQGFSSERCNIVGGLCTVSGSDETCRPEPCSESDDTHCYSACVDNMCLGCPGIENDIDEAETLMYAANPFADRVVVMVPHDYFTFHGRPPEIAGQTRSTRISLVRAESEGGLFPIPVTAHELVHTFQPHVPLSPDDPKHREALGNTGFVEPEGYWVGCENFVGVSCEIGPDAQNLMEPGLGIDPPGVWIDREVYEDIVLAGLTVTPDPAVLVVQGFVGAGDSRQAEIRGVMELPEGKLDRPASPEDTNFTIVLVDDAGAELVALPHVEFSSAIFDGFADGPTESFQTGSTRFSVRIPYPARAARLQIHKQGQIIADIDPLSESLRRLIERIPDRGLKNPAANRRETLLEKVDQFERILEHNKGAALNKLDNDLRAHVEKWVLDFDPLRINSRGEKIYTGDVARDEVLQQIDRVRARVRHRME